MLSVCEDLTSVMNKEQLVQSAVTRVIQNNCSATVTLSIRCLCFVFSFNNNHREFREKTGDVVIINGDQANTHSNIVLDSLPLNQYNPNVSLNPRKCINFTNAFVLVWG